MDTKYNAFKESMTRPFEKGRTPFDGLRPWSAITHGVGILLAIVGTVFLLIKDIPTHDTASNVGFVVFCITMIMLYTASTMYHCVNGSVEKRIRLRKFDHIAVNFLIAGTYTPLCLTILNGSVGYTLLAVIWTLSIAASVIAHCWINAPRRLTAGIYIALGWIALAAVPFIWQIAGLTPLIWMFAGGILYTIGAVLYALKWPGRDNPKFGYHEIFHVFIVLGTIAHFGFVYLYM